jgi:hypothetical protein
VGTPTTPGRIWVPADVDGMEKSCRRGPADEARDVPRSDVAGTELEVGCVGEGAAVDVTPVTFTAVVDADEGEGTIPPERKDGQSERSSGRDVPVALGEMCERMAAA